MAFRFRRFLTLAAKLMRIKIEIFGLDGENLWPIGLF